MKRILSLGLAALALGQVATHAGVGTVLVQNNNGGTIIPLISLDGTTKVFGSDYKIGVFVNNNGSLGAQVGPFVSAGANFRFTAGQQEVPGSVAGGTISLIVAAWDVRSGTDFATATIKGYTLPFQTPALGGDVDNDPNTPAATAPSMVGVKFDGHLYTPEPSTYALAALGLGGLVLVSRRK